MKRIDWAFACLCATIAALFIGAILLGIKDLHERRRRLQEDWSFVGYAPSGSGIYKRYFKDHGVWIFVTDSDKESISAVPLEIQK